jgi:hypothetical protein
VTNPLGYLDRVAVLQVFETDGGVHAAKLGAPLVNGGSDNAQPLSNLGYWQADFNLFERIHDLAVARP